MDDDNYIFIDTKVQDILLKDYYFNNCFIGSFNCCVVLCFALYFMNKMLKREKRDFIFRRKGL